MEKSVNTDELQEFEIVAEVKVSFCYKVRAHDYNEAIAKVIQTDEASDDLPPDDPDVVYLGDVENSFIARERRKDDVLVNTF